MMRRSDRVGPPQGRWSTASRGPSSGGVAGFAPGPARRLALASARSKSSVREAVHWLLVVALSSLAVACAGPGRPSPTPDRARPAVPGDEVVIGGHRSAAAPVAARRVGERFLVGYVAYLYGHRSPDRLRGCTAVLRRELSHGRVRVPPARRARKARVVAWRAVARTSTSVVVTATVDDGDLAALLVAAVVERRAGRWRVPQLVDA